MTVHSRDAVIAVEKDLLNKSDTEMFGKNRITLGSLLVHNEGVAKKWYTYYRSVYFGEPSWAN